MILFDMLFLQHMLVVTLYNCISVYTYLWYYLLLLGEIIHLQKYAYGFIMLCFIYIY